MTRPINIIEDLRASTPSLHLYVIELEREAAELLEACRLMARGGSLADLSPAINAAKAAIAKAEGE